MSEKKELNLEERIDRLEKRVEKNLNLSKEMQEVLKHIYKWVIWQRLMSFIKISLFIIVILAGIFYLPPFLEIVISKINEIYINVTGGE
jgi:hypothetical protein